MTSLKKKVLFLINSEVGGSERMSVNISKMLPPDEFQIKYVIIRDEKFKKSSTSVTDFISDDNELYTIHAKGHLDKVIKLYRTIKREKPDVVFASHYNINDKILFLKPFLRGITFIIRAENSYSTFVDSKKFIIRHTYNKADVLIAQTEEMRKDFIENGRLPEKRIVTLENPVDVDAIEQKVRGVGSPYPEDGKKHIVAVGRFHSQKGYDFLIQSLAKVRESQENVELYIVGSYLGPWESEYEKVMQIAEKLGIKDVVHCLGFNDNPFVYVKYADCFVLSSRFEGLPNVLVEALYLKTPVAAFKCIPIIERMVRDGLDGYLAEKENTDSLATAIMNALKMGRTNPVYSGATKEDFVGLFRQK
jgi:glycosyltransferase involved in cell wall biosynthesis